MEGNFWDASGPPYLLRVLLIPAIAAMHLGRRISKAAYEKLCHSNEMVHCYILAYMLNILQQKHQNIETAFNIIESLQEMFGHQNRQTRKASIRAIMNTHMKLGTFVSDPMLIMIGHFNAAEVLGTDIDSEMPIDMVLGTLPEMFS
ncbi:uncharacterized protein LOC111395279 [Olea europaea var. sylvestris]|uniref:uncharacterized protein LOC111395279 n=1 Tax=Olea europaea var. sylvestris TaxID=158386 RepID=UPI000C1D13D1|nr:uncharacterized protein LOC111395279 [Olea europaea var. sylvestris]